MRNDNAFANQYNFRVSNQIKFINLLKKQPYTLTDLADKTGLSFTAAVKVINELIDNHVVKKANIKNNAKKKGRTPAIYEINCDEYVNCAIDLSHPDITIAICSLTNEIIVSQVIEGLSTITISDYKILKDTVLELLSRSEVKSRKLKVICIGTPGFVNKETGNLEVSSRVIECAITTPQDYLASEFGVTVVTYNDIQISALGEKMFGCVPNDAKYFMFVHLGKNCGCAMYIDGHLFQGYHGYAGEFTTLVDEQGGLHYDINWVHSLKGIASEVESLDPSIHMWLSEDHLNRNEFIRLFEEKNPAMLLAIEHNAKKNAEQIIAYNDFLDLQYIILEGPIIEYFGDYYKKLIYKYTRENHLSSFNCKILYSTTKPVPSLLGTVYQANNIYFLNKFEDITNKRSALGSYNINDTFGENI